MHSVVEAQAALAERLPPLHIESLPLEDAVGRVLAQKVLADRDGPPFDRVCMDGIAIDSRELAAGQREFRIVGLQLAGHPPLKRQGSGAAIEVATGCTLPLGCDQVIRYEDLQHLDQARVTIVARVKSESGRHIQPRGEAYRKGETLLASGGRISAPQLHSLASAGLARVEVYRHLPWALVSTGDELVPVEAQPHNWQIRRSNDVAIAAEAKSWGLDAPARQWLPDQEAALHQGLEALLTRTDLIVLTGGVSQGAKDLVPQILQDLGARPIITGINQKPGKPFWFGAFPDGKLAIGLPGNPVSSLISFRRLVLPWLLAAEGRQLIPQMVSLPDLPPASPDQTLFLPVHDQNGCLTALGFNGSGDYRQLIPSSGFVELAPAALPQTNVAYFPWGICGGSR